MKKKIVAVMMCAAMVAMLGVGCGSKSSDDSSSKSETKKTLTEDDIKGSMKGVKLKVGTSGLFGPFSYYDEDGKTLIGYDLDLISDLQDLLGFEIDGGVQAMDYSALTTSLSESKLDMGAAALCATDERKEVMNFTDVYCDSGQVVMVNQTNDEGIKSVDDLKGKKVGVGLGTNYEEWLRQNVQGVDVRTYDDDPTKYQDLRVGRIDAILVDRLAALDLVKKTNDTLAVTGEAFSRQESGVALRKGNEDLLKAVNDAIAEMQKDGTLQALSEKWFGADVTK